MRQEERNHLVSEWLTDVELYERALDVHFADLCERLHRAAKHL
jgi:hypothetical protein